MPSSSLIRAEPCGPMIELWNIARRTVRLSPHVNLREHFLQTGCHSSDTVAQHHKTVVATSPTIEVKRQPTSLQGHTHLKHI